VTYVGDFVLSRATTLLVARWLLSLVPGTSTVDSTVGSTVGLTTSFLLP
jgi:hypothetical protein